MSIFTTHETLLQMNCNTRAHWPLIILLLWLLGIGLIGCYYFMPLHYDGAAWAFEIFNEQKFHFHFGYFRYSTAIPQLLSVLFSQTNNAHLSNLALSYSYFIFPYLTLIAIYIFTVRSRRLDIFYLCTFLTIFCYLPSSVFGVAIAGEAIAIFCGFMTYILLTKKPALKWIIFFCLLLLLSYEPSFILYPLVGYILFREDKLNKSSASILLIFFFMQVLNLTFSIVPDGSHQFFKVSLSQLPNSPFLILFTSFTIFLISQTLKNKTFFLISLGFLIISSFLALKRIPTHMWLQTYHDRIWAIPATFVISFIFYEFMKKNPARITKSFLLWASVFTLPLVIHQSLLTYNHLFLVKRIELQMAQSSGCHMIKRPDFHTDIGNGTFIAPWTLPYFSILLNRSRNISSILFVENLDQNGQPQNDDFCRPIDQHLRHMTDFTHLIIHMNRHYDFSPIYPQLELQN